MDLDKEHKIQLIILYSPWPTTIFGQGQTSQLFLSNFSMVSDIHYS